LRKRVLLALSPVLLVIILLFLNGLLLAAVDSLGFFAPAGESSFTLRHYGALLQDREFGASLLISFLFASISTILSTTLGLALGIGLRPLVARGGIMPVLIQAPIAIPHLAVAVALINFISPSGLIARAAFATGWIHSPGDFPALINDRFGAGIILAYVIKESPFIAVMTLAMLARAGREHDMVAMTLGASPWQRFRHVTVPMVAPAVIPASLVVFAFTFGAFDIPFLLGRQYPAMIGVVAARRYLSADLVDRPEAIAMAVLMTIVTAVLVWIYLRTARLIAGVDSPAIF
jgi:putative spermidine/putrescine transport system permease protein